MDDFKDGFAAGWHAALEEAERKCRQVWFPTGNYGHGISDVDLVLIRKSIAMPGWAKGERS